MKDVLIALFLLAVPPAPPEKSATPLDIVSDRLSVDQQTGRAVFSGNVRLRREELEVRCSELIVQYGQKEKSTIEQITFAGPVELQMGGRRGACRQAEYFRMDRRLVCTGEAWLQEGANRIAGEAIEYFLDSRRVLVKKPRAVLELDELEEKARERK
jgi:lipopolysaccharide export system protein LptA